MQPTHDKLKSAKETMRIFSLKSSSSGPFVVAAASLIMGVVSFQGQSNIFGPNWNRPHFHASTREERERARPSVEPHERVAFSFSLPSFERTTSAAVFDANGMKIRTLWMNRTYESGAYEEIWDGKDDYGVQVHAGEYKIRLGLNNVDYTWDGIIGNTESSFSSYRTWDGIVPSLVRSLAFIGNTAYSANGYNEGGYAAATFRADNPNEEVLPLTKLVFSTLQHFMFAATDGNLVYFGFQTYNPVTQPWQGVIAFHPNGDYYRFPKGDAYPSFPRDTGTFWNDAVQPPIGIADVKVVDKSRFPSEAVTGIAVQRNGKLLATAHGFYKTGGRDGIAVQSANEVKLSDKVTGELIGAITVPNPQVMAFDLDGSLWVISGYSKGYRLYRVRDVGRTNEITAPLDEFLSNPVSVSASPDSRTIFVADGGDSQQVKEFDIERLQLLSKLGERNGYLSHRVCDSAVTNTKFWFDPGPNIGRIAVVGMNSPLVSWVSAAGKGNIWVCDFSTSRILHFRKLKGNWKYIDRIMYLPWSHVSSVPSSSPTRVFGGPTGFLEFKVNYKIPLTAGDPDRQGQEKAWELARNWLPCFINQNADADVATQMVANSFANGHVIGSIFSEVSGSIERLVDLGENGEIASKSINHLSGWNAFDALGNYYREIVEPVGIGEKYRISVKKYGVSSYDLKGFPTWFPVGQMIGWYEADHRKGDPIPREQRFTNWPSSNSIIPILDKDRNEDVPTTGPAFHLGGLHVDATLLSWKTMPERDTPFTDGEGSFPAANVRKMAGMGVNAWAADDNIFVFQNGNGGPWSCQFYHFKDDGFFVGQFGFQTSPNYTPTNISWKVTGYPQKGTEQPLAPGECIDVSRVSTVKVGGDYYLYLGDESYHKGIHRWKVSNLGSYRELGSSVKLGADSKVELK